MAATLKPAEAASIQSADRSMVVSALLDLLANGDPNWLMSTHQLRNGVKKNHAPGGSAAATPKDISEYIATCAPTHTLNGWVFLSRALNSFAVGDLHSAWHFAYYAELRAALSILASNGIGVFNEWNAMLDKNGNLHKIDCASRNGRCLGTHAMTWLALECWIKSNPNAFNVLGESLKFKKISLSDVLNQLWPSTNISATIYSWLSDWSFDISLGAQDRDHRNTASYAPHEIFPMTSEPTKTHEFFNEFWSLLEPQPTSSFYSLDRQLFRMAIEGVAKQSAAITGRSPVQEITNNYGRLDIQLQGHLTQGFLLRNDMPTNSPLFDYAKDKSTPPNTPVTILSRALLLLRLSTGIVTELIKDAGGVGSDDLKFWIEPFGVQRGFWMPGDVPSSLGDLWADVEIAMESLDFINTSNAGAFSLYQWMSDDMNGLPRIWESERAALWGFAA